MKIITEVRDGKYLLGQLDHPSYYVGRLPAGLERQSGDNSLPCPCLPAPKKQVPAPSLIFAGSMKTKEGEKRCDPATQPCLPATEHLFLWDRVQFGLKRLTSSPPGRLRDCLLAADAQAHGEGWEGGADGLHPALIPHPFSLGKNGPLRSDAQRILARGLHAPLVVTQPRRRGVPSGLGSPGPPPERLPFCGFLCMASSSLTQNLS